MSNYCQLSKKRAMVVKNHCPTLQKRNYEGSNLSNYVLNTRHVRIFFEQEISLLPSNLIYTIQHEKYFVKPSHQEKILQQLLNTPKKLKKQLRALQLFVVPPPEKHHHYLEKQTAASDSPSSLTIIRLNKRYLNWVLRFLSRNIHRHQLFPFLIR